MKRVDKGKGEAFLESDDEFSVERFQPLKLKEKDSDAQNSKRSKLESPRKSIKRKLNLEELKRKRERSNK